MSKPRRTDRFLLNDDNDPSGDRRDLATVLFAMLVAFLCLAAAAVALANDHRGRGVALALLALVIALPAMGKAATKLLR